LIIVILALLTIVASTLMVFPLFLQSIYYIAYKTRGGQYWKSNGIHDFNGELPKLTVVIPTRNEDPKVIVKTLNSIFNDDYPKERLEIIIVSDDDPENYEKLKSEIERSIKDESLNVKLLWREVHRGYKAGALNYSLKFASGDYVVILDSDSQVERGYFKSIVGVLHGGERNVAISYWKASNSDATLLSKAIAMGQDFLFKTLFIGRSLVARNMAIVGSGCGFHKKTLIENPWCEECLLEDVELGLRLSLKGYNIKLLSDKHLRLTVPTSYDALKVQQIRWSNGAGQLLRLRFKQVLRSNMSTFRKLEHIAYLLSYSAPLGQLLTTTLLACGVLLGYYTLAIIPLLFVTVISTFYSLCFLDSCVKEGLRLTESIRILGRISGVTTSLTPILALSFAKGLLGRKVYWKVTPKGKHVTSLNLSKFVHEMIYIAFSIVFLVLAILANASMDSIWFLMQILPYIYLFRMIIGRKL